MVSGELTARRFAGVVRLQVSQGIPDDLKFWICRQLEADEEDIHEIEGLLSLTDLARFNTEGRADLQYPPHIPVVHPRVGNHDTEDPDSVLLLKSVKETCCCIIPTMTMKLRLYVF